MNPLPKITIITPSFNQAEFLEATIISVLSQNYSNLEYIIIDGGSTDDSVDIIKKYEKQLTYWVSEKDAGQSDAINKGLKHATGEIFNWLNSDDQYLPNALNFIGNYFLGNPETNVLCGRDWILESDGSKISSKGTSVFKTLEETAVKMHIDQPSTFFRLSCLREIGLYVEPDLHFMMDAELWLRYLLHFGLSGVKKTDAHFTIFRVHPNAKSSRMYGVYYSDRYNIYLSLSKTLDIGRWTLEKNFYSKNFKIYFSKNYFEKNFQKKISEKKFSKKIFKKFLEIYFLENFCEKISWKNFFKIYFDVFRFALKEKRWRVLFYPLLKVKRIFFKIY